MSHDLIMRLLNPPTLRQSVTAWARKTDPLRLDAAYEIQVLRHALIVQRHRAKKLLTKTRGHHCDATVALDAICQSIDAFLKSNAALQPRARRRRARRLEAIVGLPYGLVPM